MFGLFGACALGVYGFRTVLLAWVSCTSYGVQHSSISVCEAIWDVISVFVYGFRGLLLRFSARQKCVEISPASGDVGTVCVAFGPLFRYCSISEPVHILCCKVLARKCATVAWRRRSRLATVWMACVVVHDHALAKTDVHPRTTPTRGLHRWIG